MACLAIGGIAAIGAYVWYTGGADVRASLVVGGDSDLMPTGHFCWHECPDALDCDRPAHTARCHSGKNGDRYKKWHHPSTVGPINDRLQHGIADWTGDDFTVWMANPPSEDDEI